MSWNQKAISTGFQGDFEQVARIKAKYRSAVGFDITYSIQLRAELVCSLQIGSVDQMMNFSRFFQFFIDSRNFNLKHETSWIAGT